LVKVIAHLPSTKRHEKKNSCRLKTNWP